LYALSSAVSKARNPDDAPVRFVGSVVADPSALCRTCRALWMVACCAAVDVVVYAAIPGVAPAASYSAFKVAWAAM
jgi:hypothetical protein